MAIGRLSGVRKAECCDGTNCCCDTAGSTKLKSEGMAIVEDIGAVDDDDADIPLLPIDAVDSPRASSDADI